MRRSRRRRARTSSWSAGTQSVVRSRVPRRSGSAGVAPRKACATRYPADGDDGALRTRAFSGRPRRHRRRQLERPSPSSTTRIPLRGMQCGGPESTPGSSSMCFNPVQREPAARARSRRRRPPRASALTSWMFTIVGGRPRRLRPVELRPGPRGVPPRLDEAGDRPIVHRAAAPACRYSRRRRRSRRGRVAA